MINNETEDDVVGKFETEIITQNKLIELENELDVMSAEKDATYAENIQLKYEIEILHAENARLKAEKDILDAVNALLNVKKDIDDAVNTLLKIEKDIEDVRVTPLQDTIKEL